MERYAALKALGEKALAQRACFSLRSLAVDGNDLIAAGFAPCPALGRTLSALLDAVTDGRVVNEKAALLDYALSAAATDIQ